MDRPNDVKRPAILRAASAPDDAQRARLTAFLQNRYGVEPDLTWIEDPSLGNGFRLESGDDVFDWSLSARMNQLETRLHTMALPADDAGLIPLLRDTIQNWTPEPLVQTVGTVLSVEDGVATVSGMRDAFYGEILLFSGGVRGMVQDLRRNEIGCILFDDEAAICEGSRVQRTGRVAGMPVGKQFLGRVVNALGLPIDGGRPVKADGYRPMESPAPGIVERQPVNRPLETGLLAIDSMFPIGRGQRELIIGDRQTGKTAVAIDTILNQKDKNVVCIYVAIGQKTSTVAQIAETLRRHGAMDDTIIVSASASDPAPLQYIAPYAGCALGESFMYAGRDVLIVYDDLSKHAVAYRTISLLLGRSPGREAYPGDVFYLHARLLERAAHLSGVLGGGSMTALPIVETQAGDVSAYIPTNIISITDGQIFLESSLFFAGQRPAVNVGLSVSRVGGDAQTPVMKQAAGSIRLDLAQYRELEVFTQFSSDLDAATHRQLQNGQALMQLLRQPRYRPYAQHEQVILLLAAQAHLFQDVPLQNVSSMASGLIAHIASAEPELCRQIQENGQLRRADLDRLRGAIRAFFAAAAKKE